jgi:glycosyltransferase involved in cell wall biosynthesis
VYRKILRKKFKVFNIFSDPRLYSLKSNTYFNEKKGIRVKYPLVKSRFIKKLINFIDGYVFIGKYQRSLFENVKGLNKEKPYIIAYPSMNQKRYEQLIKIKPKLDSKNIIFIGGYELATELEYKGYDVLFEIFPELKKTDKKINLTIVGGGWDEKNKIRDVNFTGQLKDFSKELKESSLFLHLGLGDAFCVTAIEAMRSGLPVIISNQVGAKEVVEKVRKDFVIDRNDKDSIKNKILEYFDLNFKEKKSLSNKFRKESHFFNPEDCAKDFKKKFIEMEGKIK